MKLAMIPILGAVLVALCPQCSTLAKTGEPVSRALPAVKVTLRDGTVLKATLKGVGCPIAICSRVAFKGVHKDYSEVRQEFEHLAEIRDATSHTASFIAKDGASKRLTLLYDFRVLYLENLSGEERRVDLGDVKSVEFTGAAR